MFPNRSSLEELHNASHASLPMTVAWPQQWMWSGKRESWALPVHSHHQQQECKTYFYFSPSLPSISGGMAQATTRGVMMLPHLGFRFQAVASFQSRGKWLSFNYCIDIIVTDECLPRDILCTRVWQPALHCPVQQFREAECGSAEADLSAAPPTHHPAPDT